MLEQRRELGSFITGEKMASVHKIGQAGYGSPNIIKEIVYALTAGLIAGGLWKRHHWRYQRRTREFYHMLDRGEISVVGGR